MTIDEAQIASEPKQAKIDQAYRQLRREIEAGDYASNERLVELPLSKSLGISRNTLRAILTRLEQEGFIVLEPNRGARVRAFSIDEVRDALRAREVLEGLVARLAAERADPAQVEALQAEITLAEQSLAADDLGAFTTSNRRFHNMVVEMAASPTATSMLGSLRFPMMKFQFQSVLVPGRKTEVSGEHRQLADAISAGDADAAEQVGRWHVRQIQGTLDRLAQRTAAGAPRFG